MVSDDTVGIIHSIETCGTVDGPGIRYVVFMQGCPMRCQYCHNPDTWNINSKLAKKITVSELLEDIVKYKSYMKFSGGGVTVSGGEPLMQAKFVEALLKACKEEGISTAIDTAGYRELNEISSLFDYTDLVILDIKSIDPDTFFNVSRKEINNTLNLAKYLQNKGVDIWIRFVLVPGLTDNETEINSLAKYIKDMKNVKKVEILPFHKMGEYKWEELKIPYTLADTNPPSQADIDKVRGIFLSYGISTNS